MSEKIGLQAVLELGSFSHAVSSYNQSVAGMSSNTASAASSINSSFAGLGSIILDIGAKAAQVAVGGIALLGSALVAIGVQGTTAFIQLEQGFANLEAISGDTKAQLEPLKGLISDLALDPNLKVTANEATEALYALTKQGLSVEEIMGGAGRATVELSNATGAQFTPAATIAAGVMKAWNIEASNLSTVADGMTGVLTNSKFSVDDYNLAFAQSGAIFSNLGGSLTDFNTIIAGTSSAFSGGSDAGTSFKNLILTMSAPTKEAKAAMDAYGISIFNADGTMKNWSEVAGQLNKVLYGTVEVTNTVGGATKEQAAAAERASSSIGDLTRDIGQQKDKLQLMNDVYQESLKFYDAGEPRMRRQALAIEALSSNIQDQEEKLGEYQQAISAVDGAQERTITSTKTLTEAERAKLAETIAGRDSSRLLLELGKLTSDQYDELSGKINKNGQAMNAASIRMDTTSGALDILRGIIEAIQLQIGEKFTPMVKAAAKAMSLWASENSGTIIAFFGSVADGIQKMIDGVIKVSGAFQRFGIRGATVSILGQLGLDQSQISEAMGVVDQVIGAINRIKGAFDEFGIGGAAFSILGMLGMSPETIALIDTNLTGIIDSVTTFVDNVMLAFDRFGASGAAFSILGQLGVSSDTLITLQTTLDDIVSSITDFATQIQEAFAGDGTEGSGGFSAVFESLKTSFTEGLPQLAADIMLEIPENLTLITDAIGEHFRTNVPAFQEIMAEWGPKFWEWVNTVVDGAGLALAGIILAITEWATSPEAQTSLNTTGSEIGKSIVTGIGLLFENSEEIGKVLLKISGGLLLGVAALTGDLIIIGGQIVAGITSGILEALGIDLKPATFDELGGILTQIGTDGAIIAEHAATAIAKGFEKLGDAILSALVPGFSTLKSKLKPIFEDTFKESKDLFSGEKWIELGQGLIDGLLEGIQKNAGAVLEFLKSLVQNSLDQFGLGWAVQSPSKKTAEFGRNFVEGLIVGADDMAPNFQDRMKSIAEMAVEGMAAGIEAATPDVADRMRDLANAATTTLSGDLLIHSPSVVFDRFGQAIPQGLAAGISSAAGLATQAISAMGQSLMSSASNTARFIGDLNMGGFAAGSALSNWNDVRDILHLNIGANMGRLASGELSGADIPRILGEQAGVWNVPPQMLQDIAQAQGLVDHFSESFLAFQKQMRLENLANMTQIGASSSALGGTLAGKLEEQMAGREAAKKTIEAYRAAVDKVIATEGNNQIALDKKRLAIEKANEALGFGQRQMDIYAQELATLRLDEEGNALQIEKKVLQMDRLTESMDAQSKQLITLQEELGKLTGDMEKNQAAVAKAEASYRALQAQSFAMTAGNQNEVERIGSELATIALLQDFLASGESSLLIPADAESQAAGITGMLYDQITGQLTLNQLLAEQAKREALITKQKEAQAKLDKLKAQLDLINLGRQLGGNVLAGMKFGLDASTEDMLAAVNAITMAMVDQINTDLQIHSPSGVMIKTFKQVMAGAAIGIERGQSMLSEAMRSIPVLNGSIPQFSQQAGASNSSTYNYNFPMTVNTAATAQGVIMQYDVRRSLANV